MEYKLTTNTFDKKETQAAIKIIKSGRLTLGKNVELFEKDTQKNLKKIWYYG